MLPGSSPDVLALPTATTDTLALQGSTGTLWIANTAGVGRDTASP